MAQASVNMLTTVERKQSVQKSVFVLVICRFRHTALLVSPLTYCMLVWISVGTILCCCWMDVSVPSRALYCLHGSELSVSVHVWLSLCLCEWDWDTNCLHSATSPCQWGDGERFAVEGNGEDWFFFTEVCMFSSPPPLWSSSVLFHPFSYPSHPHLFLSFV